MDLGKFDLEELILSAIKAELDSKEIYLKLAGKVKNALLKDRLRFISGEEERHREFVQNLYKKEFPNKKMKIPDRTPVPLPALDIRNELGPLSDVFESVLAAEKAAFGFYNELAGRFEPDSELNRTLRYFAAMEMGHYNQIELEKANLELFEDYDTGSPMMHVGP